VETETLTREQAKPVVEYVKGELREKNPGLTFHISGPWRAGAEEIDKLVILVKTVDMELMDSQGNPKIVLPSALEHFEDTGLGVWRANLRTPHGFLRVELLLVKPVELATYLWWTTGPEDLWATMKSWAESRGFALSLGGLYQGTQRLDALSEYDIARLLGTEYLAFVEPSKRANWRQASTELVVLARTVELVVQEPSDYDAGVLYAVWINQLGKAVRCECRGFTYCGACKHLERAEARHTDRGARPVEDRL